MKSQGYGMDERPPVRELVPFGVQHALLVAFQALPAPLLVSAGLGFSPAETTVLVACALFVAGVSTLVQTLGIGPVGGKLPIAMVCSIVFVSPALLIAPQVGYAGYVGACLVGSLVCGVVFFAFSDRLKVVVPSFVSGAVVFVLGTTLLGVALGYCAGGADSPGFGDPANYLLAGITLATVLAFNVLGKGFLHGAAPLIGLAVGFATAAALGRVDFGPVEAAAWFAFPEPLRWGIAFPIDACITIAFLAICGVAELLGDTSATTMLTEERMPTKRETRGVIFTQAVTSGFSALFNNGPTISASADVGLLGITRVFSRHVVAVAGAIMIVAGLCPKVSALCSSHSHSGVRWGGHPHVRRGHGQRHEDHHAGSARCAHHHHRGRVVVPGTAFTAVILNLVLPGRKRASADSTGKAAPEVGAREDGDGMGSPGGRGLR